MPKLLIFDAFTLLIPEKTVANYALLRCKTFSLKIWVCKIFDKFHVCRRTKSNIIPAAPWFGMSCLFPCDPDRGRDKQQGDQRLQVRP